MSGSQRSRVVSRRWVLTAGAIGVPLLAGGALAWQRWDVASDTGAAPQASSGVPRRETRPTLDPGRFTGRAALAHRVAREMPDVLDQLHCYCGCDRDPRHVSLLSCYTDGHAAT